MQTVINWERGEWKGLTGGAINTDDERSGGGGGRESLPPHCVSITFKRKLIHSALNCMPRPPMCLSPPPRPSLHNVEEAIFKQTSQDSHFKRCNEFLKNIMVYIILYIFSRRRWGRELKKPALLKWGCLFRVEGWKFKSVCVCVCARTSAPTTLVKGTWREKCSED